MVSPCVPGVGGGAGRSPGRSWAEALAEGDADGGLGGAALVSQDRHAGAYLAGVWADERRWRRISEVPARAAPPRHLPLRVGFRRRAWLREESVGGAGGGKAGLDLPTSSQE